MRYVMTLYEGCLCFSPHEVRYFDPDTMKVPEWRPVYYRVRFVPFVLLDKPFLSFSLVYFENDCDAEEGLYSFVAADSKLRFRGFTYHDKDPVGK